MLCVFILCACVVREAFPLHVYKKKKNTEIHYENHSMNETE